MATAHHARVLPIEEHRGAVLLGIIKRYALCQMRVRLGCCTLEEQRRSQTTVHLQKPGRVLDLLRESEELCTQCMCPLVLSPHEIITPESTQHGEKLVRVFQVVAELLSGRVGLSHFGSCPAFGRNQ